MLGFTAFITSPGGIFGAIVVIAALVASVIGPPGNLVRSHLEKRSEEKARAAALAFTSVLISELASSSSTREMRFELVNKAHSVVKLNVLKLHILEDVRITDERPVYPGASMKVREHNLNLKPGKEFYDVRGRMFGPAVEPLRFTAGEVEPFLVTVNSPAGFSYNARLEMEWYDVTSPDSVRTTESEEFFLVFPLEERHEVPPEWKRLRK